MSSQSHTPAVSSSSPLLSRLAGMGALLALVMVAVNTLIAGLARALFGVPPAFGPLQPIDFLPATVLVVLGAVIVAGVVMRKAQHPKRLFVRIGLTVLVISFLPLVLLLFVPLFPDTTVARVGALALMHLATGVICLSALSRMLP